MKILKLLIGVAVIAHQMAYAESGGGWTSGGGNVLKNANNPWFLENTTAVSYCIEADPISFGGIETPLPVLIDHAFSYWKQQLSDPDVSVVSYPFGSGAGNLWTPIRVGTQTFGFNPRCNGNEDVTFRFGTLSDEQKAFLGDPTKVVGVAVRTEYDEVNLRGKGFIYISADSGPLRYQGSHLRDRAWHEGKGGILFRAIVHELGHVFGLPHGKNGLMSEAYSESLLLRERVPASWNDSFSLAAFFQFDSNNDFNLIMATSLMNDAQEGKELFGPDFRFPIMTRIRGSGGSYSVFAQYGDGASAGKEVLLGQVQGKLERMSVTDIYGVGIFLTDRQAAFPQEAFRYLRLRGPSMISKRLIGKFTPAHPAGKTFDAVITLNPESAIFDGIIDGTYRSNILSWIYGIIIP